MERPMSSIDFEKIYTVRLLQEKPDDENRDAATVSLKITYFDSTKFMKGMINKIDPFQNAEKWIKLKLKDPDDDQLTEFIQKMGEVKNQGYFLNWI